MCSIRPGGESGEQDQDDGTGHEGPFPRIMIADPAEEQLADNGASKGKGGDVGLRGGRFIPAAIDLAQHGIDLANDSTNCPPVSVFSPVGAFTGTVRTYPLR